MTVNGGHEADLFARIPKSFASGLQKIIFFVKRRAEDVIRPLLRPLIVSNSDRIETNLRRSPPCRSRRR
ncbi:protein of unknown function [Candidatus Hydrogenisulfobacillus filiaventi]|uniref:Uncharacterized protein n=1 Tax=Candidatus Hydrogenisulfobacillus filiaventi TaxID=2707344 RepID=A0A6F8ZF33_9FIRM|nr:protein of unknown function [Candidatus Hydrogenisulfobacillus filiaventi]